VGRERITIRDKKNKSIKTGKLIVIIGFSPVNEHDY